MKKLILILTLIPAGIFYNFKIKRHKEQTNTEIINDKVIQTTSKKPELQENNIESTENSDKKTEFKDTNEIFGIVLSDRELNSLSYQERKDEIELLEHFIKENNSYEKLNAQTVSQEDREEYKRLFMRISSLKSLNLAEDLKAVQKNFEAYKTVHKERVQQYVLSK